MTAMVKDELSRVECAKTSERKAEVTALLRFSGGLHIVGGRVVIESELAKLLDTVPTSSMCTVLYLEFSVTNGEPSQLP